MVLGVFTLAAVSANGQQIAFTWDDLPSHGMLPAGETRVDIGHKIIAAIKDAHMPPVYGFVNGVRLQHEPEAAPMLKDWRDAGFQLGNHTWSHMNLNKSSLKDWEADVTKNEPVLEKYAAGGDWRWLRFPYLAEGATPDKREAVRKFLAERHYKIAAVTMSFGDWQWADPYAHCVAKNDQAAIKQLEASYLKAAADEADFKRAMAKALYGHDIPYVLLMHVGALDALMLPQLIDLYRSKGFTFITLEQAEKDPFYKGAVDLSTPDEPDSLEGAMRARGLAFPPHATVAIDLDNVCR